MLPNSARSRVPLELLRAMNAMIARGVCSSHWRGTGFECDSWVLWGLGRSDAEVRALRLQNLEARKQGMQQNPFPTRSFSYERVPNKSGSEAGGKKVYSWERGRTYSKQPVPNLPHPQTQTSTNGGKKSEAVTVKNREGSGEGRRKTMVRSLKRWLSGSHDAVNGDADQDAGKGNSSR